MQRKKLIKLIAILAVIGVFIFLYVKYFSYLTPETIRDFIDKTDKWGPIVYILLWTFLPVAFFPVPVLALAGGLSFGLLWGTIYTIIGAFINSTFMFFIARYLDNGMLAGYLQRHLPEKGKEIFNNFDGSQAFRIIFLLRLIPLVPYNLINYAAGLTKMRFGPYTTATLLGIIPGTLIFLNLGDAILDIRSPKFIVAVLLLIALIVISDRIARKTFNKPDDKK